METTWSAVGPHPAAHPIRRALAYFIDGAVLAGAALAVIVPVSFVLGYACFFEGACTGRARDLSLEVSWFIATLGIPGAYFLLSWWRLGRGRTLGMRALGIQVVRLSGAPVDLARAVVRLVVLMALLIPSGYWQWSGVRGLPTTLETVQTLGFLLLVGTILFGRDHRGLHDLVAGTVVVRAEP